MMATMDEPSGPPSAPTPPDPGDCCGEGCGNCVVDLHEAAMQRWRLQLAAWKARQSAASPAGPDPAASDRDDGGVQAG
jgi:hypothetical protein